MIMAKNNIDHLSQFSMPPDINAQYETIPDMHLNAYMVKNQVYYF